MKQARKSVRIVLFGAISLLCLTGSPISAQVTNQLQEPATPNSVKGTEPTESDALGEASNKPKRIPIEMLKTEELAKLMATRLDGEMSYSFSQFSNMFLVKSRIQLGIGIGLMTDEKELSKLPLQSPFPSDYKPTLKEFLDSIALQTFSDWQYEAKDQFVQSDKEPGKPVKDLVIFQFAKRNKPRVKPFSVTLADGWKTVDQGNWVMHVPPSFPVGMDIYELGKFSVDDKKDAESFDEKIRFDISLTWANRVKQGITKGDLVPVQIGKHQALYFESLIPSQLGKDIKWRQWVLSVDNHCFFIVSTILPEFEDKIYPDVKQMVDSFQLVRE